jgi:hypothetical protein
MFVTFKWWTACKQKDGLSFHCVHFVQKHIQFETRFSNDCVYESEKDKSKVKEKRVTDITSLQVDRIRCIHNTRCSFMQPMMVITLTKLITQIWLHEPLVFAMKQKILKIHVSLRPYTKRSRIKPHVLHFTLAVNKVLFYVRTLLITFAATFSCKI